MEIKDRDDINWLRMIEWGPSAQEQIDETTNIMTHNEVVYLRLNEGVAIVSLLLHGMQRVERVVRVPATRSGRLLSLR